MIVAFWVGLPEKVRQSILDGKTKIDITGSASDTGNYDHNLDLATRRSKVVIEKFKKTASLKDEHFTVTNQGKVNAEKGMDKPQDRNVSILVQTADTTACQQAVVFDTAGGV